MTDEARIRTIAIEHAIELVVWTKPGDVWHIDVRGRDANGDLREIEYSGAGAEPLHDSIDNALSLFASTMFPGNAT